MARGNVIFQVQNAAGEWVEAKMTPVPKWEPEKPTTNGMPVLPPGVQLHQSSIGWVATARARDGRTLRVCEFSERDAIEAMASWLTWENRCSS